MKKNTGIISLMTIVIIIVIVVIYMNTAPKNDPVFTTLTGSATYICTSNKTIAAKYYENSITPVVAAGNPTVPSGSVTLSLSDGRTLTLPQATAASGARYANSDETIIFWNKGNAVMFSENGQQVYAGCIALSDDSGSLPRAYGNSARGISIRYPDAYTVNEAYSYQAFAGKVINGVSFAIPSSMATGTNLSQDSYISIEQTTQSQPCTTNLFLDQARGGVAHSITEGGVTYLVASSSDAAAGNRYEETVFTLPGTNPCTSVRYFIHYGAIENYPKGLVREFDKVSLLMQFDTIRRTLLIAQ
jgi:membrane-bound inhibitor of C-type lysozyme